MKSAHPRQSALLPLLVALATPAFLTAQTTTINVNSSAVQTNVKRFGINLGEQAFYDSGQMLKNLVFTNPSFEGEIYQSTVRCASGTANSCTDENIYSGWPVGFWTNASYQMISGASVGRSGSICSYSGANYPQSGGTFTFCDSGTVPAQGDYMVVKITMPTNVGWPNGDWQTVVGAGSLTAETYDLPPNTTGKQSALLTAPTASDSIGLNMFFDSTAGKTFLQLNGSYQLTFKAKGVAGSNSLAVSMNRAAAGLTYINQTVPLTGAWAPYTINFNASENGSAIGRVELSFTTVGADTVELDDVSLVKTGTDPTNTTVFRDEVVNTLQALHPGVLRMWEDQLGESLDNLLASPQGRQRSAYTPYNGYDGTDVNFQTQSVKFGLTDFLQLCQKVGADPWIVVPSTFSTSEAYSLIDYLAGPSTTLYGGKRAAAGQTQPWTSVFNQIHLEFGNEAWNGGTFKGGSIEYGDSYGGRATAIFTAIKGNAAYSAPSFDLIVNGQSAAPYRNQGIQQYTLNNDSFSIAPYMMYDITEFDTVDHLFGTTFAEAEAFVTPNSSSEGVTGGYITEEQTQVGKPIVTSEMNLSPSSGSISQTALNGYTSSIGGGLAVLDSMFQQLRAGVLTQNLFELPGYISNTNNGTTMYLWGAVLDMGVTNRLRPQYLALQLANNAIGSATQELQTVHTGADPTDNQYGFNLNTVTLPTFHFLQSFAFSGNGSNSLVVFNVNPDYSEQVNFAGPNAPSGTVVMQQLTSPNITDNNELASIVGTTSTTLSNFNASATMTLPPFSMTVFTWGGSVQNAPVISSVAATNITSNSATITWTTDQAASSQVKYGTTTSYGTTSALNSTLSTSHSVTLTGLTPGTTYDFAAVSANSASQSTTSGNATFTTTSAAPQITSVTAVSITSNSATITWTTDQAASSQVSYGTTPSYGSLSALNATLSTAHSVTLTGLTPGTTYDFAAISANSASQSTTSGNFTFATATVAPQITSVTSTSITSTSATITWITDQGASSQVSYGTTAAYGTLTPLNTVLSVTHTVTLTGLTPGTTYDFAAISANSASQSTTSGNYSFTTTSVAPQITSVTATSITSTSAIITWTTDQPASSRVSYGTTASYGTLSALNAALSTSHSVTLTGLTAGTTYDYAAISANSSSQSTTSGNFTFTTATVAPQITAVTATAITSNSATITWTTDQAASSQVSYGTTTSYGTLSPLNAALSTTHSVTLTGLTPGTTYDFAAISANSASQSTTSGNYTFTTTTVAPQITSVTATSITSTSATITWTTDQPASSRVSYGTTTSYGTLSALNATLSTTHSVTLTGLTASTTYDYAAISANSASQSTTSGNFTFATSAPGAPQITSVVATAITTTSATITWTTDQAASSQVSYGTTTSYGTLSPLNATLSTTHSVTLSGLTAGTTYDFAAISANSASQSATSGNFTFTTSTVAPQITAVTATAITSTSATITWTTDQPASSQVTYGTTTGYGTLSPLNATLSTTHSITLSGLTAGTTYDFAAISANSASQSATSGNFTLTTTSVAPQITAVTATAITATSATITWSTDQPASSQVKYGTTTSYGTLSALNATLSTTHSVTLTGLTAGTMYDLAAISANGASQSTTSGNFTFTTTTVAPQITAVTATAITATSATITWTTDQAASSQVTYGTTTSYGTLSALNATLSTTHTVTLTGLTAATTYDFAVISANSASQSATSANFTFTTTSVTAGGPTITNEAAWPVADNTASILWTTDQNATSQVNYGTTTAYGSTTPVITTLGLYHVVPLTGLNAGTTYHFSVVSTNASNVTTVSPDFSFTTTGQAGSPAPVISSVTSSGITSTSATITWTTDQTATSQVSYGTTTSYGTLSTLSSALVTSHSVTLTGLTPGTTYDYAVISANGSSTTSGNFTFATTTVAASGPVITNEAAYPVADNTATILWTTDQNATAQVKYGTTSAYGSQTTVVTSLGLYHAIPLTGLASGTTYHFAVISTNASNLTTTSPDFSFTTTGKVTSPAPVISAVASSGITSSSATITWTTDQTATSQVSYGTTAFYGTLSALSNSLVTSHSVTLTGLTPGTTYDFAVISANSSSASTTSANFTFTTASVQASAPVITNVASYPVGNNTATILWTTDQNATSQVNYGLTSSYGLQTPVITTLGLYHLVQLTGLNSGTTYHYSVVSANASSQSAASPDFSFTTTGTASNPAPVISSVTVSGITTTSATINWTTDQLSTSQVSYGTTTGYGTLSPLGSALVTSHTITLTGLTPGTAYDFAAISANSAAVSTTSGNFTFSTSSVGGAPIISSVIAGGITTTSATITWTTDQASSSQVTYGPTLAYGSSSTLNATLGTSHSVTLTGLTAGTSYNFEVISSNAASQTTVSTNYTFATTSASQGPAPVVSYVGFWGVTSSGVIISWSTDVSSSTQVAYGTTTALGQLSPLQPALVTSHGVTLTNLNPGTTYYFVAQSTSSGGVTGVSTTYSFTTLAGAPIISGVTVAPAANNTAVISWATSAPTYSYVQYGTTTAYGRYSVQTSLTAAPQCTLPYVPSGTIHYQLVSTDAYGNQTVSPDAVFTEP